MTREQKIAAQMARYNPKASTENRRQWATEHVDAEARYDEGTRRLREWRGTEAGMQEMFG